MKEDAPLAPKKPGELLIAFDPGNGHLFHTDFTPIHPPKDRAVGASDILDFESNKDLGFVVSMAMGSPGGMVESKCPFRGQMAEIRVIFEKFSPSDGPTSGGALRTVAWWERVQVFVRHLE